MRRQLLLHLSVLAVIVATATACDSSGPKAGTPDLEARGATMTTAKPSRQDLSNRVSLSGKVTMNPVFGLVAPVGGEVRYFDVSPAQSTPTRPTRVATIWANGKANAVEVPAGATFAGRLVPDRSTVTAGMPVVSATLAGYGIVADIDAAQAYKLSDALPSVQVQIKNGPGPFACTVRGTIAALPAGIIPDPPKPAATPSGPPNGAPGKAPAINEAVPGREGATPSEPTGMRLVCTPPADVKLINGAAATVEVVTETATNALVVPVEAVAGTQGKGKVDVVRPDRSRETRDVVLGLSDGKVVEIKSGLTGDETLAVPGPNIPPAKEGNTGPTPSEPK
ncbi:efflux RND transporter periplasmic adaptor subunit [Planosporangium mesophilum]|uniref:efflux RND transporter periplasmic adaptor subunit n=1 Tax=Planosporangium mesophilum TaxID=689768 RepID=UPI00143BC21F|nr:efflux RND transporter periplasmic adaptor subunit [Planosporangium mesophilum]NJC82555.1 efflux RND transporter periplasmic adaptor subunit [Planosporangium mesophilum]